MDFRRSSRTRNLKRRSKRSFHGTEKTGSEANFYAPTASGTEGQVLVSNGANADPSWASFTGYCPTFTDDTLSFYFGIIPEVEDTAIIFEI